MNEEIYNSNCSSLFNTVDSNKDYSYEIGIIRTYQEKVRYKSTEEEFVINFIIPLFSSETV